MKKNNAELFFLSDTKTCYKTTSIRTIWGGNGWGNLICDKADILFNYEKNGLFHKLCSHNWKSQ